MESMVYGSSSLTPPQPRRLSPSPNVGLGLGVCDLEYEGLGSSPNVGLGLGVCDLEYEG